MGRLRGVGDRHPKKDIEKVLKRAEEVGWTVEVTPGGKFCVKCSCEDRHYRYVHVTPSGNDYAKNLEKWLTGRPCWRSEG